MKFRFRLRFCIKLKKIARKIRNSTICSKNENNSNNSNISEINSFGEYLDNFGSNDDSDLEGHDEATYYRGKPSYLYKMMDPSDPDSNNSK